MTQGFAIVGPTASGKTSLAIELAKIYNGEIISCDSMQIYKYLNIGTAKPTKDELQSVPHHMIDIIEPTDDFSCLDYKDMAMPIFNGIISKNKRPIFCGGTGLYLDTIIKHSNLSKESTSSEIKKKWEDYLNNYGKDSLYEKLIEIDPISAEKTHKNNVRRVIRALEIYDSTGKTKSEWDELSKKSQQKTNIKIIVLDFLNRDLLYSRIDTRVDSMIRMGLEKEVKDLLNSGKLIKGTTASQAIGYKEFIDYFDEKITFDECVNTIKQSSRRYAKRQITWFKREEDAIFIHPDKNYDTTHKLLTPNEIINEIKNGLLDI